MWNPHQPTNCNGMREGSCFHISILLTHEKYESTHWTQKGGEPPTRVQVGKRALEEAKHGCSLSASWETVCT